ncbi:MAG: LysM peptidoglycan-binding domain-containing protein, partial [Leptospiraceae bacterium]|nr:LysM peptidoglycan-binding domain-containing protein [Leptospiraceae bacterium]
MFKKPRKLPHGKELLRTENFTLIYLGAGHLHYSYVFSNRLIYGHIDLRQIHLKLLPLFALIFSTFLYLFLTSTEAVIQEKQRNNLSIKLIEEEQDKKAKQADDEYLRKTEEQKKAILTESSGAIRLRNYYVQPGETLEEIAARFRTTPETIAKHSKINPNETLSVGQILTVPEKQGLLYKFRKGDTLAKIASTYKVSIEDVIRENNLENPDFFSAGQKIFLPNAVLPEPPPISYKPVEAGIITSGYG